MYVIDTAGVSYTGVHYCYYLLVINCALFLGSYYKERSADFWCRLWVHIRNDQQGEHFGYSVYIL